MACTSGMKPCSSASKKSTRERKTSWSIGTCRHVATQRVPRRRTEGATSPHREGERMPAAIGTCDVATQRVREWPAALESEWGYEHCAGEVH